MIPEVLAEFEDDYQFFYSAAMRELEVESGGVFPEEVVERVLAGEHPVRVFRQYRRFTQEQLARKARVSVEYIKKIELGQVDVPRKILRDIAKNLRVELSDIL